MDVRIVLIFSGCSLISSTLCQKISLIHTGGQTSTDENDGQRCTTQDECPDGMCCVHNPLSKPESRKRFIFGQYSQHDHGFCRRARHFNESCLPLGHDAMNVKLYEYYCPCDTGLECRGLVVHESNHEILHKYPVCQYPESNLIDQRPTASGPTCSNDTDCGPGMCCVLYPLSLKRGIRHGYCRNERKLNESCGIADIASETIRIPPRIIHIEKLTASCVEQEITFHDFQCPCESGLECRGSVVHHLGNQTVHEETKCQPPLSPR